MNGIERITARIDEDAQEEIDLILAKAKEKADKIAAGYKAQAEAEAENLSLRNRKAAAEREERLVSVAHMESRKVTLAAKQEMVEKAYDLALQALCRLPEAEYVEVLAELLVRAAPDGQGSVIFSPEDRARVGKAAVARANELLHGKKPQAAPAGTSETRVGALLNKVAAGAASKVKHAAAAKEPAGLTLAEETRPIQGGFILSAGRVEVNCTFDTLVRLQRAETAGAVAKLLFPEE